MRGEKITNEGAHQIYRRIGADEKHENFQEEQVCIKNLITPRHQLTSLERRKSPVINQTIRLSLLDLMVRLIPNALVSLYPTAF